jgi:hypothetical protein
VASLAALVAAASLAVRMRIRRGAGLAARREPTLLAVQAGLAGGLVAAMATAVAVATVDSGHQDWLGVPLALTPGLAAAVGIAVVALTPSLRVRSGATRSASLERRGTWTIGSRWAYLRPALAAVALVGVLLVTGLTAGSDDAGLPRAFTVRGALGTSTASPYPGWFYAAPLLGVTLLLLLTATLAMRRVATLPALESTGPEGDREWRRTATSTISLLATTGLLGYLAGVLLVAGSAIQSAGYGTGLAVAGAVLLVIAVLIALVTCACFVLAVRGAATFLVVLRGPAPLSE